MPLVGADVDTVTLGAGNAVMVEFGRVKAAAGVDGRRAGQQVQVEAAHVDKKGGRVFNSQIILLPHTRCITKVRGEVVANHAVDRRRAVLVLVDANPGRTGRIVVLIQHGIVYHQAVACAPQRDPVPMVGDYDVVLNDPVHISAIETADALQGPAIGLVWVVIVDDGVAPKNDADGPVRCPRRRGRRTMTGSRRRD
jgi:hypothetical protein